VNKISRFQTPKIADNCQHENQKKYESYLLKFADGLNLVIRNTLFMKQESQLVTYAAGPVKSTVDYIIVRQEDKV